MAKNYSYGERWRTRSVLTQVVLNPPSQTTSLPTDGGFTTSKSRFVSANLANWRYRIAAGQNATTQLVGDFGEVKRSPTLVQARSSDGNVFESFWGFPLSFQPPASVPAADLTKSDNLALASFLKKARGKLTAFNGGQFIGELRETIQAIRHPAESFRRGISDYVRVVRQRSRKVRENSPEIVVRATRRMVSGTWLEFQYGWKPLVSDIEDALQAASRLAEPLGFEKQFVTNDRKGSVVRSNTNFPASQGIAVGGNIARFLYGYNLSTMVNTRYYGVVRLDLPDQTVGAASFQLGLDTYNFVPTLWELIPYSFLVDYFTNIGDIISCLTFPTAKLAWVSKTTYSERSAVINDFQKASLVAGTRFEKWEPGTFENKVVHVERDTYGGSLVPSLVLEVPGGRSLKWLNIAALADQRRLFQTRNFANLE
ncbi:maturation protein [ssRNA phage Zoerhiza.2_8]|uniref:Maturation protein n=2 Tax=Norzivirales TaxID=2842247 RepID=A0A8S5L3P1_9VIRU|nr:maturation protein [ssRNA phage Zoerhiza.2_8]QDH89235.1 MAG: hypothetical protein H2Rhizo31581_000004 [Leviviridae sp.]DAD51999.1 TPA_asm: maturation protein [ssRNA phage Zoerhiza.2_8]